MIPLWPFLAAFSKDFRKEIRAALLEREVRMVRVLQHLNSHPDACDDEGPAVS